MVFIQIFIATDSSPFDMPAYVLCCDMLDLIADMGCIYQVTIVPPSSSYQIQVVTRYK